jgi:hypothetical protein
VVLRLRRSFCKTNLDITNFNDNANLNVHHASAIYSQLNFTLPFSRGLVWADISICFLGKQTLAEIVKSKRDASLAKKLERELATKKKEREERKRIAAAEKARDLARLEREKKKLLKVVA